MLTHREPILGPDPGSPPDEPRYRKPSCGEVEAATRWAVRQVLVADGQTHDPLVNAVRDAILRLGLGEILTVGLSDEGKDALDLDVRPELSMEIRDILKKIPAEDWPV